MRFTLSLTLASCFVFHSQIVCSETDETDALSQKDYSKTVVIEKPVEVVLRNALSPDVSQAANVPSQPAGNALTNPGSSTTPGAPTDPAAPVEDNPAVEPGIVHWHPNLEFASDKSAQTGKPVLLFHLLGNLDQRFT